MPPPQFYIFYYKSEMVSKNFKVYIHVFLTETHLSIIFSTPMAFLSCNISTLILLLIINQSSILTQFTKTKFKKIKQIKNTASYSCFCANNWFNFCSLNRNGILITAIRGQWALNLHLLTIKNSSAEHFYYGHECY